MFTADIKCACDSPNIMTVRRTCILHGCPQFHVKLTIKKCLNCMQELPWSGDKEAIHRHTTTICFTYELHQLLFADLKHNRQPSIHAFWKRRNQLSLTGLAFPSLPTFQEAFWSALRGVDCDFVQAYTCDLSFGEFKGCGGFQESKVLIADGKSLLCHPNGASEQTMEEVHITVLFPLTVTCLGTPTQSVQTRRFGFQG